MKDITLADCYAKRDWRMSTWAGAQVGSLGRSGPYGSLGRVIVLDVR